MKAPRFDIAEPPRLDERMLREIIERRRLRRQILLLRIAAVLMQACMVVFALLIAPYSRALSLVCAFAAFCSVYGFIIMSILFFRRGTIKDRRIIEKSM